MNNFVENNKSIIVGSEVVIDSRNDYESIFEYSDGYGYEPDYKNKTYIVKEIGNDDYGEYLRLSGITLDYIYNFYRHNLSLINVKKPPYNIQIGKPYKIGKDIRYAPVITNPIQLNAFDFDSEYVNFNNSNYDLNDIYRTTFITKEFVHYNQSKYVIIESIDKKYRFVVPSWFLYLDKPTYTPKNKIIRTFENFKSSNSNI
jgi:hypothetical protein